MLICPRCHGLGHFRAPVNNERNLTDAWKTVSCSICRCTGQISEAQAGWIERAPALWELRHELDWSMKEAAQLFGTTVLRWNDAEHGRANPDTMIIFLMQQIPVKVLA